MLERLSHVIVELIAVRTGVHADYRTVVLIGISGKLLFYIVKVGHRRQKIVLCGVGVKAYKLYTRSDEAEIEVAVNARKSLIARTQEIMISDKGNVRHTQIEKHIALPHKLLGSTAVGKVSPMNHEINIRIGVDAHAAFFQL